MSFDRSKTPTWRPGYRFQYEPAQKGHVLLYPEGMIKLNESAALIGGLIDGERMSRRSSPNSTNSSPAYPNSVTTSSNSWR